MVLGFGERHVCADLSRTTEAFRDKGNRAFAALQQGDLVLLTGGRGVGKTQIATTIAERWWRDWRGHDDIRRAMAGPVRYYTAAAMFRYLRDAMRDGGESAAFRALEGVGLLVIDEVQVRKESEWEDRTLTEIIDARYRAMLPTMLITNLSDAEAARSLGASVASRMEEIGVVVECNWPSFRAGAVA